MLISKIKDEINVYELTLHLQENRQQKVKKEKKMVAHKDCAQMKSIKTNDSKRKAHLKHKQKNIILLINKKSIQ